MIHPTEHEIFEASKDFVYIHGLDHDRYSFEQGAKWYQSKVRDPENEPTAAADEKRQCEDCGKETDDCICHIPQDLESHFSRF